MTLATVYSRAQCGLDAPLVCVEVHLANGLPSLSIVGLPETAVKESKDRVRAAVLNSGFQFPNDRRITVNLAPADLPKEGGRFDLAIALGILAASGQVQQEKLSGYEFLGELSLGGELRAVRGVLSAALRAQSAGRELVMPLPNGAEAALLRSAQNWTAPHLLNVCAALNAGETKSSDLRRADGALSVVGPGYPDLADVRGQPQAKRALEVAAAGGHSLLMIGPPGSGKSMLAQRLPGLLPPLAEDEALEVAAVTSISAQGFNPALWGVRPVRTPHHTASGVALVGGGSVPRPGEITLAHHGVLFLDELPEFNRSVLEVLREPLETGRITISRAARQSEFPARFQLVAAMNPCPCGWLGDAASRCRCTEEQVQRYRARISGPLLDRIDMQLQVNRIEQRELLGASAATSETSFIIRERVIAARERQLARAGKPNCQLEARELERDCRTDAATRHWLAEALERLHLSGRAAHRILRVARTLADLERVDTIVQKHLAEALGYRILDRGTLV